MHVSPMARRGPCAGKTISIELGVLNMTLRHVGKQTFPSLRSGVAIAKLTQHAQNDCFNAYLLDWTFSAVSGKDTGNKNIVPTQTRVRETWASRFKLSLHRLLPGAQGHRCMCWPDRAVHVACRNPRGNTRVATLQRRRTVVSVIERNK